MAVQNGVQMALLASGVQIAPGFMDGNVKVFAERINLASQPTADTIKVARIPQGSIPLGGIALTDTSLGTAQIALGIAGDTGKYRAAAVLTATDAPELFGVTAGAGEALTAAEEVFITTTVAALPASGILRVFMFYTWG